MENQINLQSLGCTPDKKVPTHGPGTTAYYRGKECKILSIKNGKAKIFCDGAILLVNYTSLDDVFAYKNFNESISIPGVFQYPFTLKELGFSPEESRFIKKHLGDKVIILPDYDIENGRNVKAFADVNKLIKKSKKLEDFNGNVPTTNMTAYALPQGTICIYSDGGEFGEQCFYFKPMKAINESLKNKTLFDKIEKWYSALTVDQKETLFYNLFRFTDQATKLAKKYKTLAQFVKIGTKNTPESGSHKHTGVGVANAIAAYYQSFKNEKDIMPKLASIKMDNSKDYMKYHEIAQVTALNESEAQDKYQEFFKKKLADYGVSSPAELSVDDKSKFFAEIKKEWPDAKVNESEMAFGIGSTVCFKGNNCKIVSIANGKCKLVCDGKVLYASMDELLPVNPINESISIPRNFQYAFKLDELGFPIKETQFLKKYLGDKVIILPNYDEETGKNVKAFADIEKLIKKSTKIDILKNGMEIGDMIAYTLSDGTTCVYHDGGEYGKPCFYLMSGKSSINTF